MQHTELEDLIAALQAAVNESNPQRGYWRDLWDLVKSIGTGFKDTRYPDKQDKDKAWERFQALVTRAKTRSAEQRASVEAKEREWEKRRDASKRASESVQSEAARSRPLSNLERSIADLVLLPARVIATILLKLIGIDAPSALEEVHRELLTCNEQLRDAWEEFNARKSDMLPGDKSQAYQSLMDTREKLDEAWAQLKQAKTRVREANTAAREQRQAEREQKHRDFVRRVEANMQKNQEKLSAAMASLAKQEAHLDGLREKLSSAWNDSYKERCEGWIEECQGNISSKREYIAKLEGWIDEDRAKLR